MHSVEMLNDVLVIRNKSLFISYHSISLPSNLFTCVLVTQNLYLNTISALYQLVNTGRRSDTLYLTVTYLFGILNTVRG